MGQNRTALAPPRLIHWVGLMSLGIIWGSSFMGMSVALQDLSSLWVAAGRLAIGAVALVGIEAARGALGLDPARGPIPWVWIMPIGVFSAALPFFLLSWGLQTVPSAFAGVAMAAAAVFILPMAHLLIPGETMTVAKTMGVLCGFLGVVVLIGPGALGSGTGDGSLLLGRLACIGAAGCYAVASILTRLCPPVDPVRLTTLTTGFAALILVITATVREGLPPVPALVPFLALLWVGLLPTAMANLLRVMIIRSAGPTFMSQVSYLVPLWAVIFGITLLGEPLRPSLWIALVLILGGIAATQVRWNWLTGRSKGHKIK